MSRASQVCSVHGCPNLQPCPTHRRRAWSSSDRRRELPADWRARRAAVLARDRGVCQLGLPGCTVRATEVHHVGARDDHRLEVLQAVCKPCHEHETLRDAAAARRGGGVPPSAGRRQPHR